MKGGNTGCKLLDWLLGTKPTHTRRSSDINRATTTLLQQREREKHNTAVIQESVRNTIAHNRNTRKLSKPRSSLVNKTAINMQKRIRGKFTRKHLPKYITIHQEERDKKKKENKRINKMWGIRSNSSNSSNSSKMSKDSLDMSKDSLENM